MRARDTRGKALADLQRYAKCVGWGCHDPLRLQVVTPDLSTKEMECKVDWMNRSIGIEWGAEDMARCLTKMLLEATVKDANTISVKVPPTRSDILHQVDVMEDVAIAYGYNNIVKKAPPTLSVGKQEPHSKLSHMVCPCACICKGGGMRVAACPQSSRVTSTADCSLKPKKLA